LLNPWVLIQMPFRHAVLHQWVVALHAEAFKFQLKICDLLIIDSPVALHPHIEKLREMNSILITCSRHFLLYFFLFCGSHWIPKSHMETQSLELSRLLPVLKFVLSSECNDIIMCLKRMSWNPNNTPRSCQFEELPFTCTIRQDFDYLHFYSQFFWHESVQRLELFMYLENIKNISLELLLTEDSQSQPVRSGDIQALCRLVDEKIIKTGRIGGVPTDFIFAAVNMASKILCKLYEFYNSYIGENIRKLNATL
jgi:hypothetical protein